MGGRVLAINNFTKPELGHNVVSVKTTNVSGFRLARALGAMWGSDSCYRQLEVGFLIIFFNKTSPTCLEV